MGMSAKPYQYVHGDLDADVKLRFKYLARAYSIYLGQIMEVVKPLPLGSIENHIAISECSPRYDTSIEFHSFPAKSRSASAKDESGRKKIYIIEDHEQVALDRVKAIMVRFAFSDFTFPCYQTLKFSLPSVLVSTADDYVFTGHGDHPWTFPGDILAPKDLTFICNYPNDPAPLL